MKCPKCGARLIESLLACNPPKFEYFCSHNCGYVERWFNRDNPLKRRENNEKNK